MRTTLKRGVGRGAGLNGTNGHAVFPPDPVTSVARYRQPPSGRSGLGLLSRLLLGTLLTLVALTLGVAGGAYLWYHQSVQAVHATGAIARIAQKELNVTIPGQPSVALVLGYDARAGDQSIGARSDTIMLIRADPVGGTISMLSIPRDLGVPIYCPQYSYALPVAKINSAFDECGPAGSLDTVEHLIGFRPNFMITVNFHGFKEIVDKLGGIWLDVDRRYYHVNNGTAAENYSNINLEPGYQLLTGGQALAFVRYRHTDDDYHRIARQQEFVSALKQQFSRNFDLLKLPSIVSAITQNVKVYGTFDDKTVLDYAYFAATLKGGRIFQDQISNVTGSSMTYAAPSSLTAALQQFLNPDVQSSKAANAAALGVKQKPTTTAPPPSKTTVTVLNGNGVGGAAANGAFLLRQKGYVTVLPPGGAEPDAPTENYFHTAIYYDASQPGAKPAAEQLAKLIVPSDVKPLPDNPKLRALDPGSMLTVALGETFHNTLVSPGQTTPVPQHVPAAVTYDRTTGLGLLKPFEHRVPFKLEVPTVLATGSAPDNFDGDVAARLYWIDKPSKAIRLVFSTGTEGDYWGIEETNMPDPPILDDKSFQRDINGREFQLYYNGSSLQMVVLRVHDESYWVVNTLLDALSNETMIAIAKGLKPLPVAK